MSFDTKKVAEIHRELHSHLPPEPALRVKALESLLVEKGLVHSDAIDTWIETYTDKMGPKRGAKIVAHAWADPAFKARLLESAPKAVAEIGLAGQSSGDLQALANTSSVQNLVVCTLCSCYPSGLLGPPPAWYKANEYRARSVRDPRGVLREFGVELGRDVEVRVWDSTSERRYIVIPERPAGTEGWSESDLAALVTRNSMIGTERDLSIDSPAASGEES